MPGIRSTTVRSRDGVLITLTADEYRLALLGLVDYEGGWDGLEAATAFVPDGPAKLALIKERLRPLADTLAVPELPVDALEMLAARHWFRSGMCAARGDAAARDAVARDATASRVGA